MTKNYSDIFELKKKKKKKKKKRKVDIFGVAKVLSVHTSVRIF